MKKIIAISLMLLALLSVVSIAQSTLYDVQLKRIDYFGTGIMWLLWKSEDRPDGAYYQIAGVNGEVICDHVPEETTCWCVHTAGMPAYSCYFVSIVPLTNDGHWCHAQIFEVDGTELTHLATASSPCWYRTLLPVVVK